jgi:tripartite-type tricarboxylate transporter receptor subunit TctC
MKRRSLVLLPLAAMAGTVSRPGLAQQPAWPARPVRIIVPFAAGGTADVLARLVGERLAAKWQQQVVIDNRPGAGGNIGAEQVARAAGDGHTLLLGTIGIHAASSIYSRLPYNPDTDLAPVTVLAEMPNAVIVHPSVPAQTLAELIALARQRPGALSFGSAGSGSSTHMAGELFMLTAGVQMTHVPYRGSSAALNDLVAGNIQVMFENVPTIPPLVQGGNVRVLAVTSGEAVGALPGGAPRLCRDRMDDAGRARHNAGTAAAAPQCRHALRAERAGDARAPCATRRASAGAEHRRQPPVLRRGDPEMDPRHPGGQHQGRLIPVVCAASGGCRAPSPRLDANAP